MDDKLKFAIRTIYTALTTVWEDNGNVKAEAVRDLVINNLVLLTGLRMEEIQALVDSMVEDAQ